MTRFRVPFGGFLTLSVVALGAATFDAYAADAAGPSAGRARLLSAGSNNFCDNYTSITTYPNGAVDIQCTSAPTLPGVTGYLVFADPTRYDVSKGVGNVNVPITVSRLPAGASKGIVKAKVEVASGPCSPITPIVVQFNDGQAGSITLPTNSIVGTGLGTCGIRLYGGDEDPNQWATNTSAFPTIVQAAAGGGGGGTGGGGTGGGGTGGTSCVNSAGQTIDYPTNGVEQTLLTAGLNNYVFDGTRSSTSAQGTIQYYKLPRDRGDGVPPSQGTFTFLAYLSYTGLNATFEIAFSKCPGDFKYYKTSQAAATLGVTSYAPCGGIFGSDASLGWGATARYDQCGIPTSEQWYLNWHVLECPQIGITCGQTFNWHGQ